MRFSHYQALMDNLFTGGESQSLSPEALHPLVLAYIGDAFFNLFVRTKLLSYEKNKVRILHDAGAKIVSATMQARALREMENELTCGELDIVRRGRNAKSVVPKSATPADYRYSTGFEALIGFLYLTKQHERLEQLCDKTFAIISREMTKK